MSQPVARPQPTVAAPPRPGVRLGLPGGGARLAWLLLAPTLAVVALVALIPLLQTVALSFTDARLASLNPPRFVGLQNYVDLAQDYLFLQSIRVTVVFALITVASELVLGMIVALVVNGQFK